MQTPWFAVRRGALLALSFLLVASLAACGGGDGDPSETPDPARVGVVESGRVTIAADDLEFSLDVIEAPSGEGFTVVFENLEAVPHNWSLYVEKGGEEIVIGDIITGPGASEEISVPALEPGTYFFVCDVHPTEMTGTVVVEG